MEAPARKRGNFISRHVAAKSIIGIVLMLVVFFLLVSIVGQRTFTRALLDQYSDGAFRTAEAAAGMLGGGDFSRFAQSGGKTEEYLAANTLLDELCNSSGATFVYAILPDRTDYAHITFIFSLMNRESSYTHYDFGYVRETTNDEYREKYRLICEEGSPRELVVRDKGYIETDPHITAMVPVSGPGGEVQAILCVQRQMDVLTSSRNSYIRGITLVLVGLAALVAAGQWLYLDRVFLRPVRRITDEATRFAAENVQSAVRLTETVKNRDEIGTLAASVEDMETRIQAYVGDITRITAEKERIGAELALATKLQAAFIPNTFPPFPDRSEFDVYAVMDPAKEVGGDFYDFYLIDDDHLCLVMADVSGKGIPAALFMMVSKIIIQSCAMLGRSAAGILEKTNEAICSNNKENMFVTVWLGILEISTGRLTCANAGHEYPVFKRPDGGFELYKDRHGFVIGGLAEARYREYEMQLEPGSKLFVYTDGLPEATDASGAMFGTERMLNALNANAQAHPQEVLAGMRAAVDGFVRDAEQFDDLTMLCLEYRGGAK